LSFRSGQQGRADCLDLLSALKCTATITPAGLWSQTVRCNVMGELTLQRRRL